MAKTIQDYIEKSRLILRKKTLKQIQVETAYTWCGRACAAAELGLAEDAHEYAHEALEHAALTGNDSVLKEVRRALAAYRVKA